MSEQQKTIEELLPELREAKKVLDEKIEEEQAAGRCTTDARNVYNGLCKKMDAAVLALKLEAPRNTEWHSTQRGKGVQA